MQKPTLIVIGGIPGSGKTTLAAKLAKDLGFVFINKDSILEMLWDSFEWIEHENYLPAFRNATYRFLYEFLRRVGDAGVSALTEANFNDADHSEELKKLAAHCDFRIIYIHCDTEARTGFERFKKRQESPEYHRFHTKRKTFEEYSKIFIEDKEPRLNITNEVIEVDTNDFTTFNYVSLLRQVKQSLDRVNY